MGSNGGGSMRSQLHEAVGFSVPPAVGQYGEEHRLLRRAPPQTEDERSWEQIINELQTAEALRTGAATAMVGELTAACSVREMVDKQLSSTTNDLERLRLDADADGRYVNSYLAVKSFQRSDASKTFTPAQTRSVVWCRRTADVCLNLHASSDILPVPWLYRTQLGQTYKFLDIYNFLRDRFRGLWQDLTIQHAETHQGTIEVLEISCRLLILAEELLCDEPEFNAIQNGNLLSTCLDKLMSSYDAVRDAATPEIAPQLKMRFNKSLLDDLASVVLYRSPHEAEFWCYRIILCLSTHDASASYYVISKIPQDLKNHSLIVLAVQTVRAFYGGNATRFFKYGRAAPPLVAVLIAKFTNLARHGLLAALACDSLKTQAPQIPAMTFCIMFSLPTQDSLTAYCDSVQARLRPEAAPLSETLVDVRDVDSNAASGPPKAARLKRTPDEHLRHILNTFPGGRLRLLDPRIPYQADVSRLDSSMISTSSMFYARGQRVMLLSNLALHTDSPRLTSRSRSDDAHRASMTKSISSGRGISAAVPKSQLQLSPRLGYESSSGSPDPTVGGSDLMTAQEKNNTHLDSLAGTDALSLICSEEESDGERTRKRGPHGSRPQAAAKKQKSEEKKGLNYDIRNDLYAHPGLYEEFVSLMAQTPPMDLLGAFGTQAVTNRVKNHMTGDHQNLSLPDPTAVCFLIKILGSVHSPLPIIIDALLLGTPNTKGALQTWSCASEPLPPSPAEKFVHRTALWLKAKGKSLGAVAIYYTSDRFELAATRVDILQQTNATERLGAQMTLVPEGKGCDQSRPGSAGGVGGSASGVGASASGLQSGGGGGGGCVDVVNDDASSVTESYQQQLYRSRGDLPGLIFCCSSEIIISRNALDTKVPWRVENPKSILTELERLVCQKDSCKGVILAWIVKVSCLDSLGCEDEISISEAIRQSVQKNLAVQPSLQKIILPLLNGGDVTKNSVPRNSCSILCLKRKKRNSKYEPLFKTLQSSFDHLASQAFPSVMWPQTRTCSLPFLLLNIWKKEINDSAKPTSEVSELVQCLETGFQKFLRLPYWHEDSMDCRLQMQFGASTSNELRTVRKIFKKLRKACSQAVTIKIKSHVEKEQARKSLNIQTPVSKAPSRLVEARQIVRSVIKSAITEAETNLQTPLLKAKFLLPLPLQIWTQTQHIRPWCDGGGGS